MKLLTFDVGGTEIKYAVMDENLNISERGYFPTPMDTFEHFADNIQEVYLQYKDQVEGVAMSLPGFVDVKKGRINGGGALLYNHGTDVGPLLEERLGCRVVLANDGKAAVQAEFYKGALQGCTNAAVCVIGTGVGGGLIINKQVVRGRHFTAGEFSFLNTNAEKFDDFSSYMGMNCSTTGLLGTYAIKKGLKEKIDGREFFRRLPDDEVAQEVLDDFTKAVAKQIYNFYWLLDIEKIAIGGGISRQPILTEKIRDNLQAVMQENPMGRFLPKVEVEVVTCEFHNDANLIGAFMTYLNEINPANE